MLLLYSSLFADATAGTVVRQRRELETVESEKRELLRSRGGNCTGDGGNWELERRDNLSVGSSCSCNGLNQWE